jgi:hypothetical protein
MTKKKPSQFQLWFIAQFGERVQSFRGKTDIQLAELVLVGRDAEKELRARQAWDMQLTAASYTRNAVKTAFTF